MPKPAYLYVIANGAGSHKVGLSVSPERRLRVLQTGSPRRLHIARKSEAPSVDAWHVEAYAHWLLRQAQEVGEWFSVTEEAAWVALVAAAEAVARGERAPARLMGAGRKQINHEQTMARFAAGTLSRIKAVLADREKQADFIRQAVERAIEDREREAAAIPAPKTKPTPNPPSPSKEEG